MLCDTSGKVTAEGSLLDLLLSDLLGSEMLLHVLLCPSVLPASSDLLSRQTSTTQKTSFLSAHQREEIMSTAIRYLNAKNPVLESKKTPDTCKKTPVVCELPKESQSPWFSSGD